MTERFDLYDVRNIPEHTKESIDAWVHDARPLYGTLVAILSNDLREAFKCADRAHAIAMPAIMAYLYNKIPTACYGTPEIVAAWPKRLQQARCPHNESEKVLPHKFASPVLACKACGFVIDKDPV